MGISRLSLLAVSACALVCSSAQASLVYTYDFPGSPGSGLAVDQTNPQPANATMSDYTRNGGLTGTGVSDVFGSKGWANGGALDPSIFTAFTITADPGFVLSLSQLTFDSLKNGAAGPGNAEVALFLNGSTTAYATFDWIPQNAPMTSYVFNFTPITGADNVTMATFKFFAWNATNTNELQFDNIALFGAIDVPEATSFGPVLLVIGCALCLRRFRQVDPGPVQESNPQ
jgi:hypothetical protein